MGKSRSRVLGIAILLFISIKMIGADYFISASGDDSNNGLAPGTAWATIDKVNASNSLFASGDRILFERGGTYPGSITLNLEGVTISGYGTGDKPVITGFQELSGWADQGGNIWRTVAPNDNIRILQINGVSQSIGRYPNDTWLRYTRGIGETTIVDDQLGFPAGHWDGGQCVLYSSNWTLDAIRIGTQTSNEYHFSQYATYNLTDPYADDKEYFIQNHPNTLDLSGEWACYGGYVYIYSEVNPSTLSIKVSAINNGFNCGYPKVTSNITIDGLRFDGFNYDALFLDYDEWDAGQGVTVLNCEFEDIGHNALGARTCHDISVSNCSFKNILNNGVYTIYSNNLNVSNNTFENIGMEFGRGSSGNESYSGVVTSSGDYPVIDNNIIKNVGYASISAAVTQDPVVTNNIVDGACIVKTDGGALYTWHRNLGGKNGGTYNNNIVNNVKGSTRNVLGEDILHDDVYAIYIDDDNQYMDVSNNIIMNSHIGLFIHNSLDIDFTNNTVYNCESGILFRAHRGDSPLIGGCDITNNTMLYMGNQMDDLNKNYLMKLWWNRDAGTENSIVENNVFENNYYLTPFFDGQMIRHLDSYTYDDYDFSRWQGTSQNGLLHDQISKEEPIKYSTNLGIPESEFVFFEYADTASKTFNLSAGYVDVDGNPVSGEVTINKFEALILFKTNNVFDITTAIPQNLEATVKSNTEIDLTWEAPSDNRGVTGYEIYRDNNLIGTSTTTIYNDISLTPATTYLYSVLSYDSGANKSIMSGNISATTMSDTSEVEEPEPEEEPTPEEEEPTPEEEEPTPVKNTPPVIVIDNVSSVYSGLVSDIDASSSFDDDGDSLIYNWYVPEDIDTESSSKSKLKLLAKSKEEPAARNVELRVSDGKDTSRVVLKIAVNPYRPDIEEVDVWSVVASDFSYPHYPKNIIDKDAETCWSVEGEDQWVKMKLAAPSKISHFKVKFAGEQNITSIFDIYASVDGDTWQPILVRQQSCGFSVYDHIYEVDNDTVSEYFRYVKFVGKGNTVDKQNSISELSIYVHDVLNLSGTEEIDADIKLKFYPNPAQEYLNIELEEEAMVKITGINGEEYYSEMLGEGITNIQLPVSRGVYFVKVMSGGKITTKQLIVY